LLGVIFGPFIFFTSFPPYSSAMVPDEENDGEHEDGNPSPAGVFFNGVKRMTREVAEEGEPESPGETSESVREKEAAVSHPTHSRQPRHDRSEESGESSYKDVEGPADAQLLERPFERCVAISNEGQLKESVPVALAHEVSDAVASNGRYDDNHAQKFDIGAVPTGRGRPSNQNGGLARQDEANKKCGLTENQRKDDEVHHIGGEVLNAVQQKRDERGEKHDYKYGV
jgi:hypothetical protein